MSAAESCALWHSACERLQTVLNGDVYSRWFSVIEPVMLEGNTLTLAVDNEFFQHWVEDNYSEVIKEALLSTGASQDLSVKFEVREQSESEEAVPEPVPVQPVKPRQRRSVPALNSTLNPQYTFENFIVGPCNEFSHAAATAVAKSPGTAYNPLFIYGATALGKTHLMQAIGHAVQNENPDALVCYVSTETLLNEYIDSLGQKKTVEFRKRYRNADVLLVDDIHFLTGKPGLQEEFFNLFNALHIARKQIVLSSDRPAREVKGLEQRLVSRFEWGLVTSIERPNYETRMAILRHKQAGGKVQLPDELLAFLAEHITINVRSLEGALIRALSFSSLTGQKLTIDSLRQLLRDMLEQERLPDLSADAIQRAVAENFDVRFSDMTSKRRPQSVAFPRQVAMYLCRRLTKASFPEIAAEFGKTHATVVHACKMVHARLGYDTDVNMRVQTIVRALGRDPMSVLSEK